MSTFDYPATRLEAGLLFDRLGLFASGPDVRGKAELSDDVTNFIEVVALVETDTLMHRCRWYGTSCHNAVQRASDQLHVVAVGTVNGQRNRNPRRFRQQAALDALLSPVRRGSARFF